MQIKNSKFTIWEFENRIGGIALVEDCVMTSLSPSGSTPNIDGLLSFLDLAIPKRTRLHTVRDLSLYYVRDTSFQALLYFFVDWNCLANFIWGVIGSFQRYTTTQLLLERILSNGTPIILLQCVPFD